jgi:hypothetical protein
LSGPMAPPDIERLRSRAREQARRLDGCLQPLSSGSPAPGGTIDSLRDFLLSNCDVLTADERVQRLADLLCSPRMTDAGDGMGRERRAFVLVCSLSEVAASQRHAGKLDEARRTADRMLALGRTLITRQADQSGGHIALGQAYLQLSKNAWQIKDRSAIEQNLRLCVESMLRALSLDPGNADLRVFTEADQRRLDDLLASSAKGRSRSPR